MTDPALDALMLPFVSGLLSWPDGGALFLRARGGPALHAHAPRGLVCEQSFRPEHDALERAERFGRHARKRVRRAEKQFSRNVEERPFIALLAAIGIGFLIAKLLDIDIGRH